MEEIVTSGDISLSTIDFSLLSLFFRADIIVKSVIIILILASIYSWTIIVSKLIRISRLKQLQNEFDEIFWSGNSFEDLFETFNYNQNDPKSKIFCSAINEWIKSKKQNKRRDNDVISSDISSAIESGKLGMYLVTCSQSSGRFLKSSGSAWRYKCPKCSSTFTSSSRSPPFVLNVFISSGLSFIILPLSRTSDKVKSLVSSRIPFSTLARVSSGIINSCRVKWCGCVSNFCIVVVFWITLLKSR